MSRPSDNIKILLASGSPRRRELLSLLTPEFLTAVPGIDETRKPGESPTEYALRLSSEKHDEVANADTHSKPLFTVACDTIVSLGDTIYGKPASFDEAVQTLQALSGREHSVITAMTVSLERPGQAAKRGSYSETTAVKFRPLSETEIRDYLEGIEYSDKAGAYAVQENGAKIIERVNGSISNVVGLPLRLLMRIMSEYGLLDACPLEGLCAGSAMKVQ